MHKNTIIGFTLVLFLFCLNGCKKDKDDEIIKNKAMLNTIPEFYKKNPPIDYGIKTPDIFEIANISSRLLFPQDLDFNPDPQRPNELWIINRDNPQTGGSTVMLTDVGTPNQKFDFRRDGNSWHFMSMPSAISFSKENYNWATTANILDANHSGGTYAGPTLWSSDLDVHAKNHGPGTNGSHLDMLHGSPYSMGIEAHKDNAFWVFDGYHEQIVFYDFVDDHGPGMHDHSDGIVHRYTDFKVTRDPDVPSHLVLDQNKKWLYIVDGGAKRILRLDVSTGETARALPILNEPLAEHLEKRNAQWEVFVPASFGLKRPCGIELKDNRLFVSDYETGDIICFDTNTKNELGRIFTGNQGIMGVKLGPDNKLYFVNSVKNLVLRIDPK
jgi:hypothetical protein